MPVHPAGDGPLQAARCRDDRVGRTSARGEQPDLVEPVVADIEADKDQHGAADSVDVGQDSPHPLDERRPCQCDRDSQRADDQREACGIRQVDPRSAQARMCRRRRHPSPQGTGRRCRTAMRSRSRRHSRTSSPSRVVGARRSAVRQRVWQQTSVSSRPDSSQTPSATRAMPINTVTYGMYCWTVDASDTVRNPNVPNTARKPSVIAAVAATARPTAVGAPPSPLRRAPPARGRRAASRNHTGSARPPVRRRTPARPDLVCTRDQVVSAETRSCSSCCDIAEVGLFTNVDVPSAR